MKRRDPTALEVNSLARQPGKHSVGSGLILVVSASGSASWIGRIRDPSGKRRDIGLGRYPSVSLKEAKQRVEEHRRTARDGIDPIAAKRAARKIALTFEAAAVQCFEEKRETYRNLKHRAQWLSTMRQYVFPHFGSVPVGDVDMPRVTRAMKPIWIAKPETARRVLQRIESVIVWAVGNGHRESELPMKAIRRALPAQPKERERTDDQTSVGKSHAAVPVDDAPSVVQALRKQEQHVSIRCLLFTILTAARSGEARGARWEEIDLDAATWTVPADRMKAGTAHVVALSPAAVALLRDVPRVAGTGGLVFPGPKNKALSDQAVSKMQKAVAPGTTVHGWRSTFRDWAAERTNVAGDVAEAALAHTNRNKVEAAYRRTNYLDKRRPLMAAWAEFLANGGAEVVDLDAARRAKQSAG